MKGFKRISSFFGIIFTLLILITACDGGSSSPSGTGDSGGGISGDNSLLATVSGTIDGWINTSDAYFVVAVITHEDESKETVVDATCSNQGTIGEDGSFSVNLGSPALTYLSLATSCSYIEDCTFSSHTSKGTWSYDIEFYIFNNGDNPLTDKPQYEITYSGDDGKTLEAFLVYNESRVTITGATTITESSMSNEGGADFDHDGITGETITLNYTEKNNVNSTIYAGWNWIVKSAEDDNEKVDATANTITYSHDANIVFSTAAAITGCKWYYKECKK